MDVREFIVKIDAELDTLLPLTFLPGETIPNCRKKAIAAKQICEHMKPALLYVLTESRNPHADDIASKLSALVLNASIIGEAQHIPDPLAKRYNDMLVSFVQIAKQEIR